MNANRAKKIIEHREKTSPFINRRQILKVKGIGPKVFEQCAGFVRVLPQTRGPGDTAERWDQIDFALYYQRLI